MNNILDSVSDFYICDSDYTKSMVFPPNVGTDNVKEYFKPLLDKCNSYKNKDFAFNYEGYRFRGNRIPSISGDFYALRKMPKECLSLEECGFSGYILAYLKSQRLNKGGLILVTGMPGNGKSTSCAALISRRLEVHQGICITVEDPAEMPLHGFHGQGYCIQRELDGQEEFAPAIRDAMRSYPTKTSTLMLIGEIRDSETAALALLASIDGRLVIATMHAGNIAQSVQRFISLAESEVAGDCKEILSSSLRCIIHQNLKEKKLDYNVLYDTQQVQGILNSTQPLSNLNAEASTQKLQLLHGDKKLKHIKL